jgi:hypothetical protein
MKAMAAPGDKGMKANYYGTRIIARKKLRGQVDNDNVERLLMYS